MESAPARARWIPGGGYQRIDDDEERGWWYAGIRTLATAVLGDRMPRPEAWHLDAECGTACVHPIPVVGPRG